MRKGKWIRVSSQGEPISAFAREALRARLRTVSYYLPLAARKSDRDVEYVHQLRVAARRTAALVKIFRPLLAEKKATWLGRRLKKIRRAAGEARDLDVLGRRIGAWVDAQPNESRTALLRRIEECRDQAQQPIRKVHKKMRHAGFAAHCDKIVARIHWRVPTFEPSYASAAADCLRVVAEPFFQAGSGDTADLEALHNFRIAAKHLRYSMEVFAAAFDADFRAKLYPCFEEVQERLGEIHDHAAALERFASWRVAWQDGPEIAALDELTEDDQAALANKRQSFIRWWTPERAADLRARFDQALARQVDAPGERSA